MSLRLEYSMEEFEYADNLFGSTGERGVIPVEANGSASDSVKSDWWRKSRWLSSGVRGSGDSAWETVDDMDLEGGRVV